MALTDKRATEFVCSNCSAKDDNLFICETCHTIRIPLPDYNYFTALKIPISFPVDKNLLEESYEDLLEKIHPDLFTNQSDVWQAASTKYAAFLQEAKEVLADNMKCAFYILKLYGKQHTKEDLQPDTEFLTEMLLLQEELLENKDRKKITKQVAGLYQTKIDRLTELFQKFFTATGDSQILADIYFELSRFKFIGNIYHQTRGEPAHF